MTAISKVLAKGRGQATAWGSKAAAWEVTPREYTLWGRCTPGYKLKKRYSRVIGRFNL